MPIAIDVTYNFTHCSSDFLNYCEMFLAIAEVIKLKMIRFASNFIAHMIEEIFPGHYRAQKSISTLSVFGSKKYIFCRQFEDNFLRLMSNYLEKEV